MGVRVQELLAIGESSASGITTDEPDAPEMEETPEEVAPEPADKPEAPETEQTADMEPEPTYSESAVETPKKKKKKKKERVKEEDIETEVTPAAATPPQTNGTTGEANGEQAEERKKKKIKKEKHLKQEKIEIPVTPAELPGSDSSGYISDKPSKKRKHETDAAPSLGAEPEPKKKSPKKKKIKCDVDQFA